MEDTASQKERVARKQSSVFGGERGGAQDLFSKYKGEVMEDVSRELSATVR